MTFDDVSGHPYTLPAMARMNVPVISLRLEFQRTDRKFLRNPNLNEINIPVLQIILVRLVL